MAIIHVSYTEAKRAFGAFLKHAPNPRAGACCCLDALYAAECGLAAIIMREKKLSNTSTILPLKGKSHDLHEMIKLCTTQPNLKLPGKFSVINTLETGRIADSYHFSDFHSALRYGATMDRGKLKDYAERIDKLCQWIKNVLEGR